MPDRASPGGETSLSPAGSADAGEARTARRQVWVEARRGDARWEGSLLYYAVIFLLVAIGAAVFGFGGVSTSADSGARIIAYVAIVLFLTSLVMRLIRR